MRYAAVIFDLFGTLVDNFSIQEHENILKQMASALSVPPAGFVQLWYATFNKRCTGILQTPDDNVEFICRTLRIPVEESQIKTATKIRFDYSVQSMVPRSDAVKTLSRLRSEGYKTGLISDCSAEVPAIWPDTPFAPLFDMTVFSCEAGIKKPDPQIYRLATKQLGVEPHNCLYIGDGSSQELTGALQAGMHPVLIRDPGEDSTKTHRVDAETEKWDGPVISSLQEVLALVK